MKEFDKLINITDVLLGPEGCPWDREQTLSSMRSSVLEEVCEVIEAIDLEDDQKILEELGDLLFNVIFLSKLMENAKKFSVREVIQEIGEKLIRRHPHIFGDTELKSSEAVIEHWERIKSQEAGNSHRKSALDGLPKGLPALSRAKKALTKMQRAGFTPLEVTKGVGEELTETQLGEALLRLVSKGKDCGLDAEQALRHVLTHQEKAFREWENRF